MPVRKRGNKLERWQIALVKAMVVDGRWPNDQDILAYFTRPTRSVNHRAAIIKAEGWDRFTMESHTQLWKRLDARNPGKGYGAVAVGKVWSW
jgi:hypothetical protein